MILPARNRLGAALLMVASLATVAGAQTRATLTGTVEDVDGATIAGATLTLEGDSLPGDGQTAVTNARGHYRFAELPPGVYELTASLQALQTVNRRVRVPIGSTLIVDFVLGKAQTPDLVTVGGQGPVVDVTTAATTTKLTTEDLLNLPIGGGAAILLVAPGVTPRTAFGSGGDTSELKADGGPITFALRSSGARSAAVGLYWMEEAQIAGLGARAEHGEFSGVIADIALRSGSNRFSGILEHRISPSGWVSDNTSSLQEPLRTRFRPQEILSRWNSHAQIGGPIARNRLFFFAGFEYAKNEVLQAGTIGNVPLDQSSPGVLTKLTWLPWRSFRLEGFVEADKTREQGTLGRNALPETANDRTTRIRTWNGRATWTLNSSTLLELRSAAVKFEFEGIPPARRAGPPPRRDTVTGIRSGNVQAFQDQFGDRHVAGATLTRFFDGSGGVSHSMRSGLEIERTTYRQLSGLPGGQSFSDVLGVPDRVELWAGDRVTGTGTRTTLFVQDTWQPTDRITIDPGFRMSVNNGSVPDKGRVFHTSPVSPRIGIAWDVADDHRMVVRGHYGRLHEGLYTPLFDFMNTAGRTPRITALVLGPDLFEETNRMTLGQGNVAVDDELAHAYVDQYLLGIERELFADFSLVVQYVRRNFGDIWALTDTGSEYAPVLRPDPGPDGRLNTPDDGPSVTVFNLLNPGQSFTVLTNPDEAFRGYQALQAIGQKRFSLNWQLLAAYTWSRTHGNVNAAAGENRASGVDTGADGVFFNPNRRIKAEGPISNDYRHQLNLQGVYRLPAWGGVGVSATYQFLSGGAAGRTATITGLQQENQIVRIESRGTRRIEGASALDVRVEKAFPLGAAGRSVGVYVDVLNVTNQGVPLALTVVEQSGATFAEPQTWADPRAVRIACRLKW